jgi:hypothetical protein
MLSRSKVLVARGEIFAARNEVLALLKTDDVGTNPWLLMSFDIVRAWNWHRSNLRLSPFAPFQR